MSEEDFKNALEECDKTRVKEILDYGHFTATTPLTIRGNHKEKPLHFIFCRPRNDKIRANIAEMLLLRGADPNSGTPLVIASSHGCIETVKILLEFGANKDAKNERGMTASIAPHWGSPHIRRYAYAINKLLENPPKLRETTTVAVPTAEEAEHDAETMDGCAAATAPARVCPASS